MKDFYRHLRVPRDATLQQIRDALPAIDPASKDAATFVLLDPRRRAVYDRNHALLTRLGALRAGLGLQHKPFWQRLGSHDFDPIPVSHPRVRRGNPVAVLLKGRHGRRFRFTEREGPASRLTIVLVVILLVLVTAAAVYVLRR